MLEFDFENRKVIASAKDYLLALIRYHNYLKLIDSRNKVYTDLHKWLLMYS